MAATDITELYRLFLQHPSVETDSRNIRKNSIFLALKGPHFDGNQYAQQALDKGAAYAVVDDPQWLSDHRTILVEDGLTTLQALAHHHRKRLSLPLIAITGSNGKTTTKELTHAVLSTQYRCYATEGNLNNHIGIPLTLLRIQPDTEIGLIEMGASHQKEIESYCKVVEPTHGLITNIGKAHLEGFGGIEGVKKGKGELFDFLRASGGTAFACKDFEYFKEMTENLAEIHWYGTADDTPIHAKIVQKYPFLEVLLNDKEQIKTQLAGAFNLYNILAAAAVGKYFNITDRNIKSAIGSYTPRNARSQIIQQNGNTYILDAYNANPTSMRAAISDFSQRPGQAKCLFLGAMMELGTDSKKEHQELIDYISQFSWKTVALVGGDFSKTIHPYRYFPSIKEAKDWFIRRNLKNATILIKGSRSIGMEKILE